MPIYWTETSPQYGKCRRCGGEWHRADRDEPSWSNCVCDEDDYATVCERERGDDDGVEYADPRDAMDGIE